MQKWRHDTLLGLPKSVEPNCFALDRMGNPEFANQIPMWSPGMGENISNKGHISLQTEVLYLYQNHYFFCHIQGHSVGHALPSYV